MIRVSPQLYALSRQYLDYVERGVLTDERADCHDRMMALMRTEGLAYRNRADARNQAYWFTTESSLAIAFWKLLLDFLGDALNEQHTAGTQASLPDLRYPC